MIKFRKVVREGVEYRFNSLTNEQTRINPARAKRAKQVEGNIELSKIIEKSKAGCPFCPERIEEVTPKFPREICREGRIKKGDSTIFPNLNPFGEHHAVGTITKKHFLDLDEFTSEMLRDVLAATKEYILSVYKNDGEAVWPIVVWNHMPPSAGSIVHPHVQVLVEREPTPEQNKLFEKSCAYFKREGRNYWKDLVEREKELGERYVAENNSILVMASFAPRGFNELHHMFKETSSLAELSEKQIDDFSDCLTKALRFYKHIGVGWFNLVTYSASIDKKQDGFYWLNAKLISRPYPKGIYTNDTGPMERMYDVWVIDTLPEELAKGARNFFR